MEIKKQRHIYIYTVHSLTPTLTISTPKKWCLKMIWLLRVASFQMPCAVPFKGYTNLHGSGESGIFQPTHTKVQSVGKHFLIITSSEGHPSPIAVIFVIIIIYTHINVHIHLHHQARNWGDCFKLPRFMYCCFHYASYEPKNISGGQCCWWFRNVQGPRWSADFGTINQQ